jgi:hypothetical protein
VVEAGDGIAIGAELGGVMRAVAVAGRRARAVRCSERNAAVCGTRASLIAGKAWRAASVSYSIQRAVTASSAP